jgi:hypothetical protein
MNEYTIPNFPLLKGRRIIKERTLITSFHSSAPLTLISIKKDSWKERKKDIWKDLHCFNYTTRQYKQPLQYTYAAGFCSIPIVRTLA